MARLARADVFDPSEIAIVHVMNRVVRRCFLFGDDPVSGTNFDHRKVWIEDQLRLQVGCVGIDLLGFAMSLGASKGTTHGRFKGFQSEGFLMVGEEVVSFDCCFIGWRPGGRFGLL